VKIAIPSDFVELRPGALVRRGFETEAASWLGPGAGSAIASGRASEPAASERTEAGRGGAVRVALGGGGAAWLRPYRHGGLLRRVLGGIYWERPPRAWRELVATEAARRSGIAAPEVLAAAARPLAPPLCWLHRDVLVTREIAGRRSLAAALRSSTSESERRAWLARAWAVIERLHAAGIRHPDLNTGNLLVGEPCEPIAVIDFDRAVVGAPVGAVGRAFARRRLARSVAKLGLPGLDRRGVAAVLGTSDGERVAGAVS